MKISLKIISVVLALTVSSMFLSACNNKPTSSGEKEINILCFQGYTETAWVTPFETEFDVKVNITYAGTVEEMFTKSKAGGTQYDVVSIDCGSIQRYYDSDLIQPIDKAKITNYSKMSQNFQDADYKMINGELYHIPMNWGANNIVYNKGKLPNLESSWSVLWDPKYKGQVSVTDEANNNIVAVAIALGFPDPYNLTDDQFAQIKVKLIEIVKNCRTFSSGFDNEFQLLSTGETNASISGYDSGLIMKLRDEANMDVGRLTPKEGIYAWIDGWVMLKGAAHPETAQNWMNWMLSDASQTALAKAMSYGVVNPAAKVALDEDVVALCNYDNIDNIKVPVFFLQTPEDFEKRVSLWNEAKAAQ